MSYITSSLTIIITFISIEAVLSYTQDYNYNPFIKRYTHKIKIKQGYIQGVIVDPKLNNELPSVEHYRGVPYAAPPIGELRFMPPRDAPSWEDVKYADNFGPVCPQTFPDVKTMTPRRKADFLKLREYLMNESEDCLYLNIYTPHDPNGLRLERYPVIVFIHGESYEWNSGNPYDGSVLAGYGKVVVVTFNFRLGILGFLKTGTGDDSKSNFGLVDQIAALVWIKENIAAFGGDPDSVTLLGHGTGAVCASLLTISPMVVPGNSLLFHRAILMGGTALADWALASNPQDVTYQVARALECPIDEDFEACLRSKRLDEIMSLSIFSRPYSTRFGPIIDSRIVPNDPLKSMMNFTSIFKRFELIYGVTEMESINILDPIALTHGMLQKERDEELKNYLRFTCETKPDLCVTTILKEYTGNIFIMDDEAYPNYASRPAGLVRDSLLDILSDSRTLAPILRMGTFHSIVNPQSYFYVFTHKTESKDHLRNKTSTGDELPYIFGVPLDGSSFHFVDQYTEREVLFSEVIMTYICNFAYRGNPNQPRKNEFYTLSQINWTLFDVDWPELGNKQQRYLQLDIPLQTFKHYRESEMEFWNELFPKFLEDARKENELMNILTPPVTQPPFKRPKGTPPYMFTHFFGHRYQAPETQAPPMSEQQEQKEEVFGKIVKSITERPDNTVPVFGTVRNSPPDPQRANTINLIIISGCVLLFANFLIFLTLYYKCYKLKKNRGAEIINNEVEGEVENAEKKNKFEENQAFVGNGCGLMNMIGKSSKSDEVYEAVRVDGKTSPGYKLARQLSNSTIDAHTKVRDWIAHEISSRYSPKSKQKTRKTENDKNGDEMMCLRNDFIVENNSTLGRSPTRPVSPAIKPSDNKLKIKPILIKQNSFPIQKSRKPEKVSVAIDATPSGRGPSVLAQQPIELTKSLDLGCGVSEIPLRRSITMDDFSPRAVDAIVNLTKSVNNLNAKEQIQKPTIITIEHSHSKSDPVQDIYGASKIRRLRTFDPHNDINVTCCDDKEIARPLSPEESLMTIKRRNFPKVLPDYPTKEALAQKRRSMPASSFSVPVNDLKNRMKVPPAPPVRTTSTLGRKPQHTSPIDQLVCISAPVLIEESSSSPEPEMAYNNLYVGPLIPKKKTEKSIEQIDNNPIYSSLNALKDTKSDLTKDRVSPVAIITTNPMNPLKKPEPKTVIRPKMVRQISDPKSRVIPRVTATDNLPEHQLIPHKTDRENKIPVTIVESENGNNIKTYRPTLIPSLVRNQINNSKDSSSSETSPSEESDTGTVVKNVPDEKI